LHQAQAGITVENKDGVMTTGAADSLIQFQPEGEQNKDKQYSGPFWNILIVDDDAEVHTVTRLVLRNRLLLGRGVHLLSAYSAREAREILSARNDIAVALLDVVMEADDAGLELIQWIRDELNNKLLRIILRTGQPGQAPEEEVINRYEINDYREKTELTRSKLLSTITTALRGYRDLCTIARDQAGISAILRSSPQLFASRSLDTFIVNTLQQLAGLLAENASVPAPPPSGFMACPRNGELQILAAGGRFSPTKGRRLDEVMPSLDKTGRELLQTVIQHGGLQTGSHTLATSLALQHNEHTVLYVDDLNIAPDHDPDLLRLFFANTTAALTNLRLFLELEERLDEKSILVREIHHRVKNNLQIILSLIDLSDPETDSRSLSGIRRRIGAMAVIHDRVSNINNEKHIDFLECAADIAADVAHACSIEDPALGIPTILSESSNFILPLETAVPCSLLIEEMLSTAIKTHQKESPILLTLEGSPTGHAIKICFQQLEGAGSCTDSELRLAQRLVEQLHGNPVELVCGPDNQRCLQCSF